MMTRLILLAALATSTRAWPRLDAALANYPSIHARETARLKAGDASDLDDVRGDGRGRREGQEPAQGHASCAEF